MEPVQPHGIPGQSPEAVRPPQSLESMRQQDPERNLNNLPSVSVGGDRLGHLLILPGKTVRLADIFPDGKDLYPEVYFKTVSGNIYRLVRKEDSLKLVSAKDAGKGRVGVGIGAENILDLKKELVDGNRIAIGESFGWNSQTAHTSRIMEAVIVDNHATDTNRLRNSPHNSIVEDFEMLQSRKTEQPPQGT